MIMYSCYKLSIKHFNYDNVPDKIIDSLNINGKIVYIIKWKNRNDYDFLIGNIANKKCPNLVIEYFEKLSAIFDSLWKYYN